MESALFTAFAVFAFLTALYGGWLAILYRRDLLDAQRALLTMTQNARVLEAKLANTRRK